MNVELAEAAIKAAESDLSRFDMGSWLEVATGRSVTVTDEPVPPCGTTACLAGFVALAVLPVGTIVANGGTLYSSMDEFTADIITPSPCADEGCGCSDSYLSGTRSFGRVENVASLALGITVDQADGLFYLSNLDQVKAAVAYLAENPDATGSAISRAAGIED